MGAEECRISVELTWLYVAQCVADGYHETGIVHVTLGTVNNCLEEHTSSTVIFHPGYQLPTAGSNAALIKLEYPSKHTPVQLYHTGTVGFESCDGSSRLLQVKPRNPTLSTTLPLSSPWTLICPLTKPHIHAMRPPSTCVTSPLRSMRKIVNDQPTHPPVRPTQTQTLRRACTHTHTRTGEAAITGRGL